MIGSVLWILVLVAAAGLGIWVLLRLALLLRELMKVTTGLTGLGVEIGRAAEAARPRRQ